MPAAGGAEKEAVEGETELEIAVLLTWDKESKEKKSE